MQEYHNPDGITRPALQKLPAATAQNKGGNFRLLTVEEAAVLFDPEQNRQFYVSVFQTLNPEIWHSGNRIWHPVIMPTQQGFPLNEAATYRTIASAEVFAEKIECFINGMKSSTCFVRVFNDLASLHHSRMREKGFWDDREAIVDACAIHGLEEAAINMVDTAALALVTTETSETVEALRHGNGPDDKVPQHCGAAAELADVILRIMDLSHARKWDVAQALVDKMQMNQTREKMHGKKF
jgi:NTP pyrophosphatase (non-canonical NTP hydrolase)